MRVTCSGAFSRRAANRPANQPPTITTRREPDVAAMAHPDLSLCIFIQAWIVMVIARGPLGIALMGVLPTPDHHDEHENRPRGWAVAPGFPSHRRRPGGPRRGRRGHGPVP